MLRLIISIVILSISTSCWGGGAANQKALTAAYIYNFAKFTQWPSAALKNNQGKFNVCVYGDQQAYKALRSIENKRVRSLKVKVKLINSVNSLNKCNIVYVTSSNNSIVKNITQRSESYNLLTIGSSNKFITSGGMIRMYLHQGKLRFDIDSKHARQRGLKVSSKLLKLARNVKS